MSATIRDIKEMTGLSLATISKYLNGGRLLPENAEKIENAIRVLHYEVNDIARGLVTSKSRIIGVVVFDIANVFTGTLLSYLGEKLRSAGYAAIICDSQNDAAVEAENIRFLLGKKVEGLLVIPVSPDAGFLEPALRAGIPAVVLDRSLNDTRLDYVTVNNAAAAGDAVRLLAGYGHRKIAVIGSDKVITGRERLRGFLEAMREEQIAYPEEYVKPGSHSIEHGYRSMQELLALKDRPTAVFMGNFEIILGAVMALNESSFKCPQDISLIGFDDLIISNLSNPRLFLIVQPLQEMAEEAVRILLKRIGKKRTEDQEEAETLEEHEERILMTHLVKGESIRTVR